MMCTNRFREHGLIMTKLIMIKLGIALKFIRGLFKSSSIICGLQLFIRALTSRPVVSIVGVLAQFLWEAQAHKVSGRYIIGNC